MDEQVNPCDDFYEFACGSFIKNTVIPSEKTSISQFTVVSDALKIKMRKLVEAPVEDDEPESLRHIKDLFVSCREKGGCFSLCVGVSPWRGANVVLVRRFIRRGEGWFSDYRAPLVMESRSVVNTMTNGGESRLGAASVS